MEVDLNATILWDMTHVVWYNFRIKLCGVTSHRSVTFMVIRFQGHLMRCVSLRFYIILTETERRKWLREINTCR